MTTLRNTYCLVKPYFVQLCTLISERVMNRLNNRKQPCEARGTRLRREYGTNDTTERRGTQRPVRQQAAECRTPGARCVICGAESGRGAARLGAG